MSTLEKQDYSDNMTCIQPINFDASKDANKITRSKTLDEWFSVLYTRIYWMFRYCDSGSARKYQKQLKGFARRVQRGQNFTFMHLTDEEMEQALSSGKCLTTSWVFWNNFKISDYDEANYDNYFVERQDKIENGDLVLSSNEDLDDAISAFEAIDWGIFGDYDYYYNYWILVSWNV